MATTDDDQAMPRNGGSRPVPDPTVLTDRAIAKLESSLTAYIDGKVEVIVTRIEGIDEATKLRLAGIEGIPGQIDEKVGNLRGLHSEKFESIQTQFRERDTRSATSKEDSQKAVDAAFAAQKEAAARQDEANAKAIDKSERATAETIKTNQELAKSTTDALTKSLDEVKLAVSRIESVKQGATENRTGIYATIGIVVTLALFGMALIAFFAARAPV